MLDELYKLKRSNIFLKILVATSINEEVANILRQLARHSDNVWKSKSYTRAAQSIQQLDQPITKIQNLKDIPGIGHDINEEIKEYLQTGTIKKLELLKEQSKERRPYSSEEVVQKTKQLWEIANENNLKFEITGSVRRKEDQVKDIDAIIEIGQVPDWIEIIKDIGHFKAKGAQVLDFTINGVDVNLRAAKPEEWESVVLFFTGPNSHTIFMRQIAKERGYTLNRHGLFDENGNLITTKEKEIFDELELPWTEPENR